MTTTTDHLDACLDKLHSVWPFLYAQWLIEDPATRDYRVVCSRSPDLSSSYTVAHRTGVIGQVFRTGLSIVVEDGRAHALYDVFDPVIDWEIAIPCRNDRHLAAVLNLEGSGRVDLDASNWHSMAEIVTGATGWRPPADPPDPRAGVLVDSVVMTLTSPTRGCSDVLVLARAVAVSGKSIVVVGDLAIDAATPWPTLREIELQGLTIADHVRGVADGLDVIRTGSGPEEWRALERLKGLELLKGRYEFILLCPSGSEKQP